MAGSAGKRRWKPGSGAKRSRRRFCCAMLLLLALTAACGATLWRSSLQAANGTWNGSGVSTSRNGGSISSGSGGVGSWLSFANIIAGRAVAVEPFDPAGTLNLEALDGTGGRQGPRRWDDGSRSNPAGARFSNPRDYLSPEEFATYQRWLAWSDKPRGMDYLQPSKEYFSLGKVKPWSGDIAAPGAMKAMLEARSYKKEIIHACIAGGDTWRIGLNFIFNMRDLGYEHWVIYVPRQKQCKELEAALSGFGSVGCMWTTMFDGPDAPEPLRQHPEHLPLKQVTWVVRWVHMLRAVRLGYNMFNIDTDLVIHDCMYKYLKGPLLGNLTWTCGDEDNNNACNGGTNYIQNAAPNGAAAWMAGTMVDRMLRLAEDVKYWEDNPWAKSLRDWSAAVDDQGQLNSAIPSATTGLYVLPLVFPGMDGAEIWDAIRANPWEEYNMDSALEMPDFWQQRFGTDRVGIKWHKLEPATRQLTPIFNNSRGPFTEKFWADVAAESGPITWHDVTLETAPQDPAGDSVAARPDPWAGFTAAGHDGSDGGAGNSDTSGSGKAEYLGKAMNFIISNWHSGFRCGNWFGLKPPRSVVGHTVLIYAGWARVMFFKISGWFHWKVEQLMMEHMGAPGFYPVSTPEAPHPKLLAVAPSANLDNVTSANLADIGFDLITAAELSGRKLVWPLIGCATQWLIHSEDAADHHPGADTRGCLLPRGCRCGVSDHWYGTPWHYMPVIPLIDEVYTAERKYCIHWRDFNDCWKHTLMYPDAKHMLRHFPPSAAVPAASNTLFHDALADSGEIGVESMTADALGQHLKEFEDQPVLYLGKIPRVSEGAAPEAARPALERVHRDCRPVWRLSAERLESRLRPLLG